MREKLFSQPGSTLDLDKTTQNLVKATLDELMLSSTVNLNVLHYGDLVVLLNTRTGELTTPITLSYTEPIANLDRVNRRGPKSELKFRIKQNLDPVYQLNNIGLRLLNSGRYLGLGNSTLSHNSPMDVNGVHVIEDVSIWHLTAVGKRFLTRITAIVPLI